MKMILPFTFIFFSFCLHAQQIFLKGKISDAQTGDGVSFAHVGICGKSIGTVANDLGIFEFRIPAGSGTDTLCASAIGYETFQIAISEIKGDKTQYAILLKPYTTELSEILIKDERVTARRIIAKAIARIPKNYPKKAFELEGYYRDYIRKNDEYVSFLEGVMNVADPGFNEPSDKSDIKIAQLRYSKDYPKYFKEYVSDFANDSTKLLLHGISPTFRGNEFSNLYYHNPLRNHSTSVPFIGVFDTFAERTYDFEIEFYTYIDGREVCVINIAPQKDFRFSHVSIKGKLFIRMDDFAIIKFNYAYFVTKNLETRKWFELNVEYREFEQKMHLKYFSFMNYFKLLTTNEIAEMTVFREYFVNKIYTGKSVVNPDAVNLQEEMPLYLQNAPNSSEFWNNYSRTLLEQPLME
jgi:hypothetical protein